MDLYRMSTVDVPEFPIASGARGPWQQQRCDSLHCHDEWWSSVPPSIAICFTQSLKTLFCTTTSCHYDLIQKRCSTFVNMVVGRSHYPYESQRSTHCSRLTEYCRRSLDPLTHLTVLVHVHKADRSRTHHRHVTAFLPLLFIHSAHSPTFPSLHLRHNAFYNPSIALPTSQLILQRFPCFSYVTVHYPALPSLLLRHKLFTEFTWRAAHG